MTVRWPTGLGCQIESADIRGGTFTVVGDHFPATIKISGRKTATLSMFGGRTVLHMKKTKEATDERLDQQDAFLDCRHFPSSAEPRYRR